MRDTARSIIGLRHVAGILVVLVVGWAWVWAFDRPAHAETVGYRIEVRACRGADCKLLPVSKRRWLGRYACQSHASIIEQFGRDVLAGMFKRLDWVAAEGALSARCVAVDGMARA